MVLAVLTTCYGLLWKCVDFLIDSVIDLLAYPRAPDRNFSDKFSGLLVGHRGVRIQGYPENTLVAFELAAKRRLPAVEFDIHLSSDGVPIVFHNSSTGKIMNKDVEISSASIDEIKSLIFRSHEHRNSRIPSLEHVLKLCKELEILAFVEIKGGAHCVKPTGDLIRRLDMEDSVVFVSFYPNTLRKACSLFPNIPRILNLLPRVVFGCVTDGFHTFMFRHLCKYVGASAVGLEIEDISEYALSEYEHQGLKIFIWGRSSGHDGVNDPERAKSYLNRGYSVCTDRLQLPLHLNEAAS